MKIENIAAVVITFNRLELLKKVIGSLKNQTRKPDKIIVVNNSSTDGTEEWLDSTDGLEVIKQENSGSSGGQYTGIRAAYKKGYDWIWTMDDDVIHSQDCLENLIENLDIHRIHVPVRYNTNNKIYENDVKKFNLTIPFSSIWNGIISEEDLKDEYVEAEGITFEGPIFHKGLVKKIGLPERNFFIYADDAEYFIRAKKAGYRIFAASKAKSFRQIDFEHINTVFTWKNYYYIRNIIAIDVLHGNLPVRILRPFAYLIRWLFCTRTIKDLKTTLKAFSDGYFYKSSNNEDLEKYTQG